MGVIQSATRPCRGLHEGALAARRAAAAAAAAAPGERRRRVAVARRVRLRHVVALQVEI
jgi:hypothetical protein